MRQQSRTKNHKGHREKEKTSAKKEALSVALILGLKTVDDSHGYP
jgi:hypothetical protein